MKAIRVLSIVSIVVAVALGSHAQDPLTNGLVAYYPFNGDANEGSGNGNNGVAANATLDTDRFGASDSAYNFNGQNAQIIVNDNPALRSLTSNYTFNAWVRFAAVPTLDSSILIKSAGAGDQSKWTFWQHVGAPPLGIGVLLFRPADGQSQWNDNHPFATNRWYMLTFSASGTNCVIAVDGVVVSVQPGNMTLPDTTGLPLSMGGAEPGGNQWFNGSLDDIRIYNRALSSNEVQQLHQAESSPPTPPISNDGVIYVANQGTSNVRTFALTNGADLGLFASNGLPAAHGIALDAAGNVYVASITDNFIRRFSPSGADLGIFATNGISSPRSIVFDADGNLYVANAGNNTVRRYSAGGADLGNFISNGLANPTGMAFDDAGNLFVANYSLNQVKKFAPNGAPLGTAISAGLNQPVGIVVLPNDGGFYVANDFASSIIRYDANGTIVSNLTSGTLGRLFYLASDADGNLYVTRVTGNAVRKFSPTGQDLGDIATTGLDIPAGIAIRQSVTTNSPAIILAQPSNQQPTVGTSASFSVVAGGTQPLVYQWRFNGTNLVDGGRISGATGSQLVISNVLLSDAGAYSVVISNSVNSVLSSNATLTVTPPVSNDGVIYVANQGTGNVRTFALTNGADLGLFASNGLPAAHGIALDTAGNVYVASLTDNFIRRFSPSGVDLGIFAANGKNPSPADLIGWWRGEGNAADVTGNHNGIITTQFNGSVSFSPGKAGNAFNFSGSDFVEIQPFPLTNFTIECWVNQRTRVPVTPNSSWGCFIISDEVCGVRDDWHLGLLNGGQLLFHIGDGSGGVDYQFPSTNTIPLNTYVHVAVTRSTVTGKIELYINGVLDSTFTAPHNRVVGMANPDCDIYPNTIGIGNIRRHAAMGISNNFDGLIDEPAIYNRALSAAEIAAIYNASTPSIDSPRSIVFDTNGNLYVANAGNNTVRRYSPGGADLGNFISNGLAGPTGMAFDDSGNLYVANYDLNQVKKFAPNGSPLGTVISTGLNQPTGLLVLPNDGGFYVANDFASSIIRYNPNGTIVSNLTSGTLGRLFYLASDTEGNLYVTRVTGNAVRKFSPSGQDLGDIATTGMDIPAGIAIRQSVATNSPAVIIAQPSNQQRIAGENVSFSVVAGGTQPLFYQWRLNETNLVNGGRIAGASSPQLSVSDVQLSDAGAYSVVVSNSVNVVTSSTAVLTVTAPPVSDDAIFISNYGNGLVRGVASDGTDLGNVTTNPVAQAQGIALDAVGNIYVVSASGNFVRRFSPTGADLGMFATNGLSDARSLVFDTNGNLYVANAGNNTVRRYSAGGADLGNFISNGLTAPTGLAFDAAGNLYVANYFANSVRKYGPNGADLGVFISSGLNKPVGLGVGPQGDFFVANDFASSVARYSSSGIFLTNLTGGMVGRVQGLAIDAAGNIYVAQYSANAVRKFSASGQDLGNFATNGLVGPGFIAVRSSVPSGPVVILAQPTNQQRTAGQSASFSVVAEGAQPLFHQWSFNGTNLVDGGRISGATSSQLLISNVQLSDAGSYSVVVSNIVNSVPSSNATLTVIAPPALVSVVNTTNAAGGLVTVPIRLVANGNENALGFSLTIGSQSPPVVLTFDSVVLGSNAAGASLLVNTNQLGSRRIGVAIALPGNTFAAGTQEVVQVRFQSGVLVGSTSRVISLTFGDQPTVRQLVSTNVTVLPATYANGAVTLMPSDIEGDSVPRPNGDRVAGITDWVQIGRFVALLDTPAVGGEFQRADCAPKEVLGDGLIKVTDWVQAGRYAAGLDPLRAVGGPTSPSVFLLRNNEVEGASSGRDVRTLGGSVYPGQTISVPVVLESQGDENALSFSVAFNPAVFSYAGLTAGSDGMTLSPNVNTSQIASGKLGIVVGLSANGTFASGPRELLKVNLEVLPTVVPGSYPIGLGDLPVLRGISNPGAGELPSTYTAGALSVALPSLQIAKSGQNITLSWPAAAADFTLQTSSDGSLPGVAWTNVPGVLQTNGGDISITLPLGENAGFYRLHKP